MFLTTTQSLLLVAVVALATHITRALPFIIFPENKETPKYVLYLGKVLPYAAMALLVIYCLRNISFTSTPYGIPEIIAVLCVVILHLWKENTLLSVGAGTAIYMILVQLNVFG
ncbi:MAG: branched-chain amino acid transporter AzlD [Clostridiaceae bacterium]|nr:branched-chain amino acid transporter AzlD [Clostridiaceae bacterium]